MKKIIVMALMICVFCCCHKNKNSDVAPTDNKVIIDDVAPTDNKVIIDDVAPTDNKVIIDGVNKCLFESHVHLNFDSPSINIIVHPNDNISFEDSLLISKHNNASNVIAFKRCIKQKISKWHLPGINKPQDRSIEFELPINDAPKTDALEQESLLSLLSEDQKADLFLKIRPCYQKCMNTDDFMDSCHEDLQFKIALNNSVRPKSVEIDEELSIYEEKNEDLYETSQGYRDDYDSYQSIKTCATNALEQFKYPNNITGVYDFSVSNPSLISFGEEEPALHSKVQNCYENNLDEISLDNNIKLGWTIDEIGKAHNFIPQAEKRYDKVVECIVSELSIYQFSKLSFNTQRSFEIGYDMYGFKGEFQPAINACFESDKNNSDKKLKLKWTIDRDGAVSVIKVIESTTNDQIDSCVKDVIKKIVFVDPFSGHNVTFSSTFHLDYHDYLYY